MFGALSCDNIQALLRQTARLWAAPSHPASSHARRRAGCRHTHPTTTAAAMGSPQDKKIRVPRRKTPSPNLAKFNKFTGGVHAGKPPRKDYNQFHAFNACIYARSRPTISASEYHQMHSTYHDVRFALTFRQLTQSVPSSLGVSSCRTRPPERDSGARQ